MKKNIHGTLSLTCMNHIQSSSHIAYWAVMRSCRGCPGLDKLSPGSKSMSIAPPSLLENHAGHERVDSSLPPHLERVDTVLLRCSLDATPDPKAQSNGMSLKPFEASGLSQGEHGMVHRCAEFNDWPDVDLEQLEQLFPRHSSRPQVEKEPNVGSKFGLDSCYVVSNSRATAKDEPHQFEGVDQAYAPCAVDILAPVSYPLLVTIHGS